MTTATDFHVEALSEPENGRSADFKGQGADHLTGFRASELDTEGGGADDVVRVDAETGERIDPETGETALELISQDVFYEVVFKTGFAVPGMLVPDFAPVAVQPNEEDNARAASDATYRLLEIYYPKALMPGSDTLVDLLKVGSFVLAKAMLVRVILEERRIAKLEAVNERKGEPQGEFRSQRKAEAPANANTPPAANTNSPFAWADEGGQAA